MKEISVIVPCYNVEEYLDACLESLVSQTLGLERMELILVDDASQDATLEHLRAWEREYPEQILVVECAENGRQGTARNIGMQYATGEYIGFVDSDDWVEPDMYEVLLERGREQGCEIVSCHAFRNKEDGRQVPEPTEREDSLIRRERSTIQGETGQRCWRGASGARSTAGIFLWKMVFSSRRGCAMRTIILA